MLLSYVIYMEIINLFIQTLKNWSNILKAGYPTLLLITIVSFGLGLEVGAGARGVAFPGSRPAGYCSLIEIVRLSRTTGIAV